jgi:localization factor PodJL
LIAQAKAAAFTEPSAYRPRAVETSINEDLVDAPLTSAFADARPGKIRSNYAMRTVLMATGTVALVGIAATGYLAISPQLLRQSGVATTAKPIPVGPASNPAPAAASAPAAPQAAVALATAPTPKDNVTDLDAMYRDAAGKVDANDPTGVAPLRTAANLGYAPAQRRLGKLYEDGGAGVEKDAAEGRRWTMRAAGNGDARAMHNLGLDYYEGIGGPKSLPVAANWFQKAAELGLRDSQYNLARFMEAGVGLPQDLPGAYRWYLIAARAGDTEAQTRADQLKTKLPAEQASRAQSLAGAFRPDPVAGPASLTAMLKGSGAKQLSLAQRALAKLGYYKGSDDGQASQALGEAIQAYQRERGLAANGQLSPELVQTFAHIAQ